MHRYVYILKTCNGSKGYAIVHLNATVFTKLTVYDWEHYVHRASEMFSEVRQGPETLGKATETNTWADQHTRSPNSKLQIHKILPFEFEIKICGSV